ncbi:MAG TPA: TIGR01777 family oxidoreductase [Salegentibacter sp.]|uniref:TIGR01777 family oxidoreductase n=1 Tax=Salegentibacter sp. TaxID=1903072 RepID=UPI002F928413
MRVLITGATGLIGTRVTQICHEKGIKVNYLTTTKDKIESQSDYKGFYWNPEKGEMDPEAFKGVSAIINLVGENIAKRWTQEQKDKILSSRVDTAALLHKSLQNNNHHITHFISASAIGIYPSSLEKLYTEDNEAVDDSFVGKVVVQWEEAADNFRDLGMEVTKVRIGLVLAREGGLLEKLKEPVNFNVGSPLGSGKQWQSWIHINDVAGIFVHTLENKLEGTYNAVAPNPVTNKELVNQVASKMGKSVWLPNVPAIAIKAVLGEMSRLVLSSQLVSSNKIEQAGYRFEYTNVAKALEDLMQ